MAKRKRAPHEKPFSRSTQKDDAEVTEAGVAQAESPADEQGEQETVAAPFVGRWNQLISTTNWEKGQIICEWRVALKDSGAAVTEYSDEAWASAVGGVTSQHVGRLRRVYERFGDVSTQYEGLHWSHFQACLDWDDAEMWLEGSIQNGWSVSQMRGRRWETVGASPEQQKAEVEQLAAEQKSEADAEEELAQEIAAEQDAPFEGGTVGPSNTEIEPFGGTVESEDGEAASSGSSEATATATEAAPKRTRLSVDVESLPDDLAEAFEAFKLAIIAHRRENWRDTTAESVVECLESLKQLTLAPSDES